MSQVPHKPRLRPRPKQIRLVELAARNRDGLNQRNREMEDEAQANKRPRKRSEVENQQVDIEPLEGVFDATTRESVALEKRLCDGYRERGFLLDWGLKLLARAEELKSPDGLALAGMLCEFGYEKLNTWHDMALHQAYQADADRQLRDGIMEDLLRHGSSTHTSLRVDHPELWQWHIPLSPQRGLFARAMRTLRKDPEKFVPQLVGPQSYARVSREEREQALFRDLIYFNARDILLASDDRKETLSVALMGLSIVLSLFFVFWTVRYGGRFEV